MLVEGISNSRHSEWGTGQKEASALGLHFDCDLGLVSKQEQIRTGKAPDACVYEWREASGPGTLFRCGVLHS